MLILTCLSIITIFVYRSVYNINKIMPPHVKMSMKHDMGELFLNPYMSKEPIFRLFKPPLECQRLFVGFA
jgi:hypothetical protein